MSQEDLEVLNFLHQFNNSWFFVGFILLAIWSLSWKGVALWKASKNSSLPWFIAMLILNTAGILEIIYVFYFSKKKEEIAK